MPSVAAPSDRADEPEIKRATSTGVHLPAPVQAKMENAFDFDFSAVRVHQGVEATTIGARAYARACDLHFAPGQYDPGSTRGQQILGHELAHVVQQSEGRVAATGRIGGVGVNDNPALEHEAGVWGARAARGAAVGRSGTANALFAGNALVQRFTEYPREGVLDATGMSHWKDPAVGPVGLRVTDDGTAAIQRTSQIGSKTLYVSEGRLPEINNKLRSVNSPMMLEKVDTVNVVWGAPPLNTGGGGQTLVQVTEERAIPSDCGVAAHNVTGATGEDKTLKARYIDKAKKPVTTTFRTPEMMKFEILVHHFGKNIQGVKTVLKEVEEAIRVEARLVGPKRWGNDLEAAIQKASEAQRAMNVNQKEHDDAVRAIPSDAPDRAAQISLLDSKLAKKNAKPKADYDAAFQEAMEADRGYRNSTLENSITVPFETLKRQHATVDKRKQGLISRILKPYESLNDEQRHTFDKEQGLNRYADPEVGEAYTISSGEKSTGSLDEWNFHWGGVIFKAGSDNVTKENYAGQRPSEWVFQIYGVPSPGNDRMDQTFHEQHRKTDLHGVDPMTLTTKKV